MSQKLYVGGIAFTTTSEGLRAHFGLQIEHHTDHARTVSRDAQLLDIGIVDGHLAVQLGKRGRKLRTLQIEHQALGILH